MTYNPYEPREAIPWFCVNGHYNAHIRDICRYCDVPYANPDRKSPPHQTDSRERPALDSVTRIVGVYGDGTPMYAKRNVYRLRKPE